MEYIDKEFIELIKRNRFTIEQPEDDDPIIQDEVAGFSMYLGELTCLHINNHVETHEEHLEPPMQDYDSKFIECDTCREDVSDEVGFPESEGDE